MRNRRCMFKHIKANEHRAWKGDGMDRASFLFVSLAFAGSFKKADWSLSSLEVRFGGRLGVAVLDSRGGAHSVLRANERFPMCSTFKALLAGAILSRIDNGRESSERRIVYTRAELQHYSPVTSRYAGRGYMSVAALCQAAIEYSDNTAANLLLHRVGGPAGLTAFARSIGDFTTRCDRYEPELNDAIPGDDRDTTTPAAMVSTLQKLVMGTALSLHSQRLLLSWLENCKTGKRRIRAGVPPTWRVGDKTGTGDRGTTNDIAVLYPPRRSPIFVAAYYTGSSSSSDERDFVLAEVGRAVSTRFA